MLFQSPRKYFSQIAGSYFWEITDPAQGTPAAGTSGWVKSRCRWYVFTARKYLVLGTSRTLPLLHRL